MNSPEIGPGVAESKPIKAPKISRKVGAVVLGFNLGLVGGGVVNYDDPLHFFKPPTLACPPTASSDIDSISRVLDRPDHEDVPGPPAFFGSSVAEKFGLTLMAEDPHRRNLQEATDADEALRVFNKFWSPSGISFEFDRSKSEAPKMKDGVQRIAKSEKIDGEKLKIGAETWLNSFRGVSVELLKASGIKKVKITKALEGDINDRKFNSNGRAKPEQGVLYIRLNSLYGGPGVMKHELGHAWDYKACGAGWNYDYRYAAANPSWFKYGATNEQALGTILAEGYGGENMTEDKATLTEELLPYISKDIYTGSETLRHKSAILLNRMQSLVQQQNPNADLIGYLRQGSQV